MMESPGEKHDEGDKPSEAGAGVPFGLLIAILFLRITVVMTFFLMVGLIMASLLFLTEGAASSSPFPERFVRCLVVLIASIILLVLWVGAAWLDANLSQRTSPGTPQRELHLSRQLFIPATGGVTVYSGMAILLWLLSFRETNILATWLWPLAWGIIGTSALFLWRHLNKTLPRE